jgi:hypothetical protein
MAKILLNHPVPTIECGCQLFGKSPVKHGWLTLAGTQLFDKVTLWFPQIKNDYWNNNPTPTSTYDVIYESPKDPTKNARQIQKYRNKGEVRVTFLKDYGTFHDNDYHFVGIYILDEEATNNSGKTDDTRVCVWKRVCKECDTDIEKIKDILRSHSIKFKL